MPSCNACGVLIMDRAINCARNNEAIVDALFIIRSSSKVKT
jgi:hypothetical protein